MSENMKTITFFAIVLTFVLVLVTLFKGSPDLHDVLINRLSNGQVPIPKPDGR